MQGPSHLTVTSVKLIVVEICWKIREPGVLFFYQSSKMDFMDHCSLFQRKTKLKVCSHIYYRELLNNTVNDVLSWCYEFVLCYLFLCVYYSFSYMSTD